MSTVDFLRRDKRWLSGGFLLFLLSCFGQTFFISLFGNDIRAEHGLSHGQFGGLYMAATLVSALVLTKAGPAVDRYPARHVVLVAVPMLALGAFAMAASGHVIVLFAAVVLLRFFGQGMMTHIAFTVVGRWFTGERGRAMSVSTLGLNAGEALFPLLVVLMVAAAGWRQVWWLGAVVLLVAAFAVAALFRRERMPAPDAVHSARVSTPSWTRRQALRDPYFYLVCLAMGAPALIGNTVFFNQVHLADLRGWPLQVTATAFTVYAVSTVVFNVIGGHLVDRLTALRLVPLFLLPLGGGLLVLGLTEAQWGLFAFMALYGVTNGLSLSLFGATWPEIYGVDHLGAIRSVVVAILVFASAAGPGLSGLLIDGGVGYPHQVVVLGVYCVAVSALMVKVIAHVRNRRHRVTQSV
ncbi:MFS family permease [Saccharothrix ecbatanensis]|uniref:MFS family permease n=1 Tax=Saccharothrix ecbatanensis TaxID=1105145 RepID=A0A7W9HHK1_9PSEU|nr:MFS transporter [Saccharothrix ecbatanensis]MBB5802071.1 MFS family permease [Saccharothrix ecbatanensis]